MMKKHISNIGNSIRRLLVLVAGLLSDRKSVV